MVYSDIPFWKGTKIVIFYFSARQDLRVRQEEEEGGGVGGKGGWKTRDEKSGRLWCAVWASAMSI